MENTAVVILNWNGKKFLQQFLPSLVNFTPQTTRIVVADNASNDDSEAFVKSEYPQIEWIQNAQNFGFAGGYNKALSQIKSRYYVLLNSDIELSENWLEPLINQLNGKEKLAAVQPSIRSYANKAYFEYAGAAGGYIDADFYPFCRGRIFDTCEKDEGQYTNSTEIAWATGACIAIKAKCFWEVGGLDADFFAHMEEIDLCLRLKNRGYSIEVVPQAVVYHVGGGTLNKSNPFKTYLNYRNNLALIYKNYFEGPLVLKLLKRMILDGISGLLFLKKGEFSNILAIIKAHFSFYASIGVLHRKRKFIKANLQTPTKAGIYRKSILWAYFIQKKTTFSSLNWLG